MPGRSCFQFKRVSDCQPAMKWRGGGFRQTFNFPVETARSAARHIQSLALALYSSSCCAKKLAPHLAAPQ